MLPTAYCTVWFYCFRVTRCLDTASFCSSLLQVTATHCFTCCGRQWEDFPLFVWLVARQNTMTKNTDGTLVYQTIHYSCFGLHVASCMLNRCIKCRRFLLWSRFSVFMTFKGYMRQQIFSRAMSNKTLEIKPQLIPGIAKALRLTYLEKFAYCI